MADPRSKGHFLALEEGDLAPWRGQPISRLLVQFLAEEREANLEGVAQAVDADKVNEARVLSGRLRFIDSVLAALHPPERPKPEPEEEYQDPAHVKVER